MNRVVVTQAAAGLARLPARADGHAGGRVIVGYDARHKSDVFARDTAEILAGAGFDAAAATAAPIPTPVVAFGIRHFGCVAGVVVTASHNPPQDNGYKVYLGDGSQIVPPADAEIAAQIAARRRPRWADAAPPRGYAADVGAELLDAYVARAASLVPADAAAGADLGLHRACTASAPSVVRAGRRGRGLPRPASRWREQAEPDPDVPDRRLPQPGGAGRDRPGARPWPEAEGADVVDRQRSGRRPRARSPPSSTARWRMLTGDELGALLADDALRRGRPGTYACSVVSSTLLGTMAAAARAAVHVTTLTGFKWIGRVPDLAFGYEEAIGYCVDPGAVPDKDGITAAAARARADRAGLKADGPHAGGPARRDRPRRTASTATSQLSVRVADLSLIADAMARLRAQPAVDAGRRAGDGVRPGRTARRRCRPPTRCELTGAAVHVVAPAVGHRAEAQVLPGGPAGRRGVRRRARGRLVAAGRLAALRREMAEALGVDA